MSEDMDSKGIYFDLQWKTKSGGSNAEEFGSIGIWEVDDSSLDWFTFKPYLCQTLGNVENVLISYIDSDGDEIPIDSDLEFQEALKFARRKAALRQKIVLKVEKLDNQSAATGGAEILNNPMYLKSSNFFKERLKINCSGEEQDSLNASAAEGPLKIGNSSCKMKTKSKSKDTLCPLQSCDSPPLWFKKYMKKMKSEIITEVTANVNSQIKKVLEDIGQKSQPRIFPIEPMNSNSNIGASGKSNAWLVTKTKKKTSDDDSSDGLHKVDIKDSKILKKIEKLNRREKKLDHKKEKLEQKTKRIAERKEREYLSKMRLELAGCKMPHVESTSYKKLKEPAVNTVPRQKVNSYKLIARNSVPPQVLENASMGVSVNSDDMRSTSVKRNSTFTKVWKVINSGGVPWTDETEVKLSWGNAGLNPEALSVKCPPLAPGEGGEIAITFTSPNFAGIFESHWHFYHKNIRFGGRMSCIVSVDLIKSEDEPKSEQRKQSLSSSSSTEFIVVPSTSLAIDGSNADVVGEALQNDTTNIHEDVPLKCTDHNENQAKMDSFSSASRPWVEDKKCGDEENCTCVGEKEAELESISTDDLSGSDGSLASDSDENFVVVPMPPCFRFDVPLNSGGPNAVKLNAAEFEEHEGEPKNPPPNETPQSPMHMPSAPIEPCHKVENTSVPDYPHLIDMPLQREVSHDTGEVISVPLIPQQPKPSMSTPQFQPAVTQMFPKTQEPKPCLITPSELDRSSSSPITSQNSSSNAHSTNPPSPGSDQSTTSSPSPKPAASRSHENTGSNEREGAAGQSANIPHAKTSPRSSPRSSRPIDLKPRMVTEVINGAISVTSSALNTAFAALDSILENTTGSSVTPGTVYSEPSSKQTQKQNSPSREDPPPPPIDAVMAEGLTKLANMGFLDVELNQALMRVHNHNLAEVIEALLNERF